MGFSQDIYSSVKMYDEKRHGIGIPVEKLVGS